MARKKKEINVINEYVIDVKGTYKVGSVNLSFFRTEDGSLYCKAVRENGFWYITQVSIEDIRTLLDIDPNVKIVIKED